MVDIQNLKKQTIRSTAWMYGSNVVNMVVNGLTIIVLARLLTPSVFGLLGMVNVFTSFLALSSDLGLSMAIIREQNLERKILNSCFWLNIYVGLVLFAILFLAAKPIASFYNQPELISLTRVISLTFIITSFGELGQTLLKKELHFNVLARIEIVIQIIYSATTITLAINKFGVYSLALGSLFSSLCGSLMYIYFSRWRPHLPTHPKNAKKLIKFGLFVTGSNIANYIGAHLDYLLVGKFLGSTALGLYSLAFQLIMIPNRKITRTVSLISYPSLVKVQDSDELLRAGYNKLLKNVAFITFPLLTILMVCADPLIPLLYGENWRQTAFLVQIMCLAGALKCVGWVRGSLFLNKNRPELSFYMQLFYIAMLAIGVTTGLRWGLIGVATGITVFGSVIFFYFYHLLLNKLSNMTMLDYLRTLKAGGIPAIIVSVAGLGSYFLLKNPLSENPIAFLVILLTISVGLYFVILFFSQREFIKQLYGETLSAFTNR